MYIETIGLTVSRFYGVEDALVYIDITSAINSILSYQHLTHYRYVTLTFLLNKQKCQKKTSEIEKDLN